MDHIIVFANILDLTIGFAVVFQGFQLYRSYPFPAVRTFAAYIALYNLVGLLTLIAQYLMRNVGSIRFDGMYVLVVVTMGFVGFALAAVEMGMLSATVWHLAGKGRVPTWYVFGYSLLCSSWLAAFGYGSFRYFQLADKQFLLSVHEGIVLSLVALDVLLPALLLLNSRDIQPDRQKRIVQNFGIFLFALGCMEIVAVVLPASLDVLVFLAVSLTLNICLLLYFGRFAAAYYGPIGPASDPSLSLDWICAEFHLSARERDIIRMILKGKSNKEIEQELFISPHTVKNHVYHIFQKAGIKSRGQLVSMILRKSAGPSDRSYQEASRET